MTTLYLIRHGETAWNAGGRFQGQQDSPLNDIGRKQALATAAALAATHLDAVYTSDLRRAADTASALAAPHGLTPVLDARLREAHFGAWEGHTLEEVAARWPEELAAWRADALRNRPPDGEEIAGVCQRVIALVREVIARHAEGAVVLVGHGGSLRAAVLFALGADLAVYRRLRLDNGSISAISIRDERMTVLSLNDTCHLRIDHPREETRRTPDPWRIPPP